MMRCCPSEPFPWDWVQDPSTTGPLRSPPPAKDIRTMRSPPATGNKVLERVCSRSHGQVNPVQTLIAMRPEVAGERNEGWP